MQQPTPTAIEREREALRDIRRRSSAQGGPGALILDPDLPAEKPAAGPPPLSPQAWTAGAAVDGVSTGSQSPAAAITNGDEGNGDDPFHLFWVPARLHPEIAPSEFRAFLKEHAHGPNADGTPSTVVEGTSVGAVGLQRANSGDLGRKRSMLSRQYKPRANDGVEEEKVVPLQRNRSRYAHEGPQLTINDLQKLEALAEEASQSDDPTKLRRVLRRSMSLNVAPSFLDQMDDVPDTTDEADAPIIVPPPNQILRRTARTKIRKPNLSGDGGGHRFPASRRGSGRPERANSVDNVTSPIDDLSSSGHGEVEPSIIPPPPIPRRKSREEPEDYENRRLTYSEETSIYDAYADHPEEEKALLATSPPARGSLDAIPQIPPMPSIPPIPNIAPTQRDQPPAPAQAAPVLHQPTPQRHLASVLQQEHPPQPSRTPSPDAQVAAVAAEIQRPDSRSSITSDNSSFHGHGVPPSHMSPDKRKEKDKKSLWRKVGGGSDKASKKAAKEKEAREREREKEKDSGFFGSLFGGGKKKQEEEKPSNMGGGAGPATAAALLGVSKSSKAYSPSISPQLGNPYARYPIHVERAVYRLSHIKLANPRRPLYEQVLISNLMFWYLGVINKSQQNNANQNQNQDSAQNTEGQQATGQAAATQGSAGAAPEEAPPTSPSQEKEQQEREQREREERERAEKERVEREREQQQQRSGPRRGSLTKPVPASQGAPRQRAEIPVKGPQYHIQSQVIEKEYGSSSGPVPVVRTSSAPPPAMPSQNHNGGYPGRGTPTIQPVKSAPSPYQQQQQPVYPQQNGSYYGRSASLDMMNSQTPSQNQSSLPPGAMPPASTNEQLWLATQSNSAPTRQPLAATQPNAYPPNSNYSDYGRGPSQAPPRSTRTPPPGQHYGSQHQQHQQQFEWARPLDGSMSGKLPSRSLSANAAPTPDAYTHQQQRNGVLRKKPASAIAVPPDRYHAQRGSSDGAEEEDMPLAVWQQRRK